MAPNSRNGKRGAPLQTLTWKKFSGQRNQIKRIKADYGMCVEELDEHNLHDALKVNQC